MRLGWSSVGAAGYSLQPLHYSKLTAPNLQHTANQEQNDQCGNQHHSRESRSSVAVVWKLGTVRLDGLQAIARLRVVLYPAARTLLQPNRT